MRVDLTQSHIDNGVHLDCNHCSVALALQDMGLTDVVVTRTEACWIDAEGNAMEARLPWHATRFLDLFDRNRPVRPFFFVLEPHQIKEVA